MPFNKKKLKFKSKFHGNDKLTTGGRKKDSNYYRRQIGRKKIAYISHLIKNTNQLLIVSSVTYPQVKPGLIDRFLILAQREGVEAIIVLTKLDLEGKRTYPCQYASKDLQKMYQDIGYTMLLISMYPSMDNRQTEVVTKLLKEKITAVVGHSGVGKTTLLNNVDPSFASKVEAISSFTRRGRHTTKSIRFHPLPFGGAVYDMPGLKEIDFIDIHPRELSIYYPEFKTHALACQFRDCIHLQEKICGIKSALREGLIHPLRYQNYLNILKSLEKNK